jgi:O-antigen ligase
MKLKNTINNSTYSYIAGITLGTSAAFVTTYGNLSNAAFFLFLIYATAALKKHACRKLDRTAVFLFLSPAVAVGIGQIIRGDLNASEYDAPIRLVAAFSIYLFAWPKKLDQQVLSHALAWGATVGLLVLAVSIDPKWTSFYEGRFATSNSAPNDLGGYAGLMLIVATVALLNNLTKTVREKSTYDNFISVLTMFAMCAGFYVLVGTQSRGPWLVVGSTVLIVFAYFLVRRMKTTAFALLLLFAVLAASIQTEWVKTYRERAYSAISEPINWFKLGQKETSGGIRLSMILASALLFSERPLSGYGDFGYSSKAREAEFSEKFGSGASLQLGGQGGPHNEIAARSLQSGIWGLLATVFLLVYPVYRFGRQTLEAKDENQRHLSFMGFIIFTYIFLLSFVLEPYSLKHTATFNALLLAVLLGATAEQSPNSVSIGTTSASDRMEPDRTRA